MTAEGFESRVAPLLGRHLVSGDEVEFAPRVAVIGYDLWQRRFAGDTGVLNRRILVNGVEHAIVGVMPARFAFPHSQELWMALRATPLRYARGGGPPLFVFGRLAPGATREQGARRTRGHRTPGGRGIPRVERAPAASAAFLSRSVYPSQRAGERRGGGARAHRKPAPHRGRRERRHPRLRAHGHPAGRARCAHRARCVTRPDRRPALRRGAAPRAARQCPGPRGRASHTRRARRHLCG